MLVQNLGTQTLRLVLKAGMVELKPTQAVEMTEQEYKVFSREFPALDIVQAEIHSEPNEVKEVKEKPNAKANGGKSKKQRK